MSCDLSVLRICQSTSELIELLFEHLSILVTTGLHVILLSTFKAEVYVALNMKITHGKFPTLAKKLEYGKLPT